MTLPEKLRDVRASIGLEWDARHRQYVFDVATEAVDEIEHLRKTICKEGIHNIVRQRTHKECVWCGERW